ncbi:hypothetical protein BX666DRAFT_1289996 [Dichotomocladium elegans]|nr:hypothetical protein BX666DRAFT_1289996 [Dichotomocladium elegans]
MYILSQLFFIAFFATIFAAIATPIPSPSSPSQDMECPGVKIIFPSQNASFEENRFVYLVLGNEAENVRLENISIHRHTGEGEVLSKDMQPDAGVKSELLSHIAVFQEELTGLGTSLPNRFMFRVELNQHGRSCTMYSPEFEVTAA